MNQTKQATILVVDDDDSSRKLLESMLAAEGKAGSGHAVRTASEKLSEARFMLTDYPPPPPQTPYTRHWRPHNASSAAAQDNALRRNSGQGFCACFPPLNVFGIEEREKPAFWNRAIRKDSMPLVRG